MILMDEKKLISGNNAIQPEYETLEIKKENKINHGKRRDTKNKLRTIRNIAIVFVVGFILVYRYSVIYNMQKELNSIQTSVDKINKQNENLTVDLVKYNNIEYIENMAVNKLHMVQSPKSSIVYANLNKKIVKQQAEEKKNVNILSSMWNSIKQFKWR